MDKLKSMRMGRRSRLESRRQVEARRELRAVENETDKEGGDILDVTRMMDDKVNVSDGNNVRPPSWRDVCETRMLGINENFVVIYSAGVLCGCIIWVKGVLVRAADLQAPDASRSTVRLREIAINM